MRVIIEIQGDGSAPEIVLRSASTGAATTSTGATTVSGAIDAGAAPAPDGTIAVAQGMVTTPMMSASIDPGSAQSAGSAPSPTTAG